MNTLSRNVLLLAATLLVACAKPAEPVAGPAGAAAPPAAEAPPQAGSCLTQAVGVCQDFHGPGHSASEVQTTCVAQNLRYAPGACPVEDRIGTCLLFVDEPIASRLRYYTRFGSGPDGARQQCELKLSGRWLPG